MLKYNSTSIVLEEVPDEISLCISISGCEERCPGCHSAHTWNKDLGEPLTLDVLEELINKNKHISCVLFFDGLHIEGELLKLFAYVKSKGLMVAFYTGKEEVEAAIESVVDYLKLGKYIEELGGLDKKTTNQRMYFRGEDITYKFWREL